MANSYGWSSPTTVKAPDKHQDSLINASKDTGKSSFGTHSTIAFTADPVSGAPRQAGHRDPATGITPSKFFAKI